MADVGIPELFIILAIVLILFGPSRLAGLGKALGQGIHDFRAGMRETEPAATEPAAEARESSADN